MTTKVKYEYKRFEIDMGVLTWSTDEQFNLLVKELKRGWEIVYSNEIDGDIYFILRRKNERI